MKTKSIRFSPSALFAPALLLLGTGSTFGACSGKFRTACPEGTEQTAGGGDINDACTALDKLPAGSGGIGGSGESGRTPSGSGGGGGIALPGLDCTPDVTKCEGDKQENCSAEGKWVEAQACEIGCDIAGSKCVVPVQLAAGDVHACARLSDGTARCWGSDSIGELGNDLDANDSTRPVPVLELGEVVSIDVDAEFSCATLSSGNKAACWGRSHLSSGPDFNIQRTPVVVDGATGIKQLEGAGNFLCVLKQNGSLECKGQNNLGQLGNGQEGASPGLNFAPTAGFPSPPVQLSISHDTACAVSADDTVACWGSGGLGSNGSVAGQTLRRPTVVSNVANAREVITGQGVSCAIRTDKNVMCWGHNGRGQLGLGFADGNIRGANFVPGFGDVERMAIGHEHVCAAKADRTLWCWGNNYSGQLGTSCDFIQCTTAPPLGAYVASPIKVPLEGVVDVATGLKFTCALTVDHKIYCWGNNSSGQLGNGTIGSDSPTPTLVRWK